MSRLQTGGVSALSVPLVEPCTYLTTSTGTEAQTTKTWGCLKNLRCVVIPITKREANSVAVMHTLPRLAPASLITSSFRYRTWYSIPQARFDSHPAIYISKGHLNLQVINSPGRHPICNSTSAQCNNRPSSAERTTLDQPDIISRHPEPTIKTRISPISLISLKLYSTYYIIRKTISNNTTVVSAHLL